MFVVLSWTLFSRFRHQNSEQRGKGHIAGCVDRRFILLIHYIIIALSVFIYPSEQHNHHDIHMTYNNVRLDGIGDVNDGDADGDEDYGCDADIDAEVEAVFIGNHDDYHR